MRSAFFSSATPSAPASASKRFSTSRKLTAGFWCRSKRSWILRRSWRGRRIEWHSAKKMKELPEELYEDLLAQRVVIFAGAGTTTESASKALSGPTFYENI